MPKVLRLTRAMVDKLPATIPDPGQIADIAELQSEAATAQRLADALAARPDGPIWVFAYGSLIWNPGMPVAARRNARIEGWHRAFCLGPDTRYRGNPDNPAVMLSLDRGGHFDGVALCLPEEDLHANLLTLFNREPPLPPKWLDVQTDDGVKTALVFVAPEVGTFGHVGAPSLAEVAKQIAPAVGIFGNMPDYVLNTVEQLEAAGLHDETVWELQALLAAELEKL